MGPIPFPVRHRPGATAPWAWPAGRGPRSICRAVAACAETALSFFYPDVCQFCGKERATAADGYIGPVCQSLVRRVSPPFCDRCGLPVAGAITHSFECANCRGQNLHFSRARASVAATGMVLEIIHRWKYSRALWFEPFLARLLVQAAVPELREGGWDLIVPIPLHPGKEAEREFNQAEHLAGHLGRATGLPVGQDLIRRVNPTRTQTSLSRSERARNMRRAFARGRRPEAARGRRIVLIDDVFTTGATTSACARVLKRCGAAEVCVWTLARGLIHSPRSKL